MTKKLLLCICVLALLFSCTRSEFEKDYRARLKADDAALAPFMTLPDGLSPREREALRFLYAYMPLADVTDYPTEFYIAQVRKTFQAVDEMPWGGEVPPLLFRHFVLPLRANNEDLDESRSVFYDELKPRVEGLGMREAILEVNHWCHEKVSYQPSDARTHSPLASVKTAFGRCGEESTFTVAALRAVGIPARQVYTPRWAHTDDNHAWVEAWADGQWWFIGACEPEPVLNLGWFNAPASRAMLMHTKAFGKYNGPEEVVLRSPNYTEINLIDNYAATARAAFRVVDTAGAPVDSARVDFCIYNYAEFYPAVAKYTDADGRTFLTAGLGDMLAWASKGGRYGFAKVSFGRDEEVLITLDMDASSDGVVRELDMVPPPENVRMPEVTPQMRAENDRRFAREDSLRHAYIATFPSRESARAFVQENGLPDEAAALLVASTGNHATVEDFLRRAGDKARAVALLQSLSWKDLRDVAPEVLWDSYAHEASILCPRVENEFLSPYKGWFLENVPAALQERFRAGGDADAAVAAMVGWMADSLRINDNPLIWRVPVSPRGVWLSRQADPRSRGIFFVSLARSFGVDAQKDPVTGKLQYRTAPGEAWKDVDFGAAATAVAPTGTLQLSYDGGLAEPGYYSHFSLSRIDGGRTSLLAFDEGQVDMGGGAGYDAFRRGIPLDEGCYLLVSGNRLADGSVPVTLRIFRIRAGETSVVPLDIRTVEDEVSVIGSFDSETRYVACGQDGVPLSSGSAARKSILSQTGRGYFAVAVLEVGSEPTNHVLRDMAAEKEALEAWGRPILLLTTSAAQMERLQRELAAGHFGTLPSTVMLGIDADGAVLGQAVGQLALREGSLPVVFIADTFNRVVFVSQGYTIGLGARLADIARKL